MSRVLGKSVLFYLVDQSLTYVNSGNSTAAGVITINGTKIAISNSNVAAIIQVAINGALGGVGSAGLIASIADAGGGDITVTDFAHGLTAGDSIIISGCADEAYNGTFEVESVPSADTFTVTATYTATDTGYWESADAGYVTVSLATETFTVLFNCGTFNEMTVTINSVAVVVTDATTPSADKLIAEQTNLEISYDIELDDVTNKDGDGLNEAEAVELSLSVTNQNIYTSSDANYQLLRDACDAKKPIYAYIVKASGIPIACAAVISKLEEAVETKKVVRANCSWKSTGAITRIT